MTTTLTHPPAEDLGCFIEGTLDDEARAAVVEHLADCDDCRISVVDATAFADPAAFDEDLVVKQRPAGGRWWKAAAAAAVVLVAAGTFVVKSRRESLAPAINAFSQLQSRPIEGRLSEFPYVSRKVNRGERETDIPELQLTAELSKIMERTGDNPKTLHDRGVALLLNASLENPSGDQKLADEIAADKRKAVEWLQTAATRAHDNVTYQNDLAAALITTGDYNQALTVCERALQIDRGSRELLFNQAIAQSRLDPTKGIDAFKRYLAVDSTSPWADEARRNIENLQ